MVVVLAVLIVVVMVRRIVVLVVLVMVQWVMGTEYVGGGLGPGSGSWSACTIYPLCSTAAALFF